MLNENPCKGQIKDGWKSCSTCDHVNSVYEGNCEYVCLGELRYQAQRELLGKVVDWLEGCMLRITIENPESGDKIISMLLHEDEWQELKKELKDVA